MINLGEYSKSDVDQIINEWIIGRNGERNRKILHRKLIDGVTYTTLMDEFGLSDRRLKEIVRDGKKEIALHLSSKA